MKEDKLVISDWGDEIAANISKQVTARHPLTTKQHTTMASKPVKRKVTKTRRDRNRDRERTIVRFKRGTHSPSPVRRKAPPPSPNHLYAPRLHRELTEKEILTPLGLALSSLTQRCLGPELDPLTRATAQIELSDVMDPTYKSMSRNLFGLDFLDPIYVTNGFAHWQEEPEKRIICFLPVKLPRLKAHPQSFGSAFIRMPKTFAPHKNLDVLDLANSENPQRKRLSIKKIYVLVLKLLGRALLAKSVSEERIHFSSTQRLMEITLLDSKGWIGEVIPVVVTDRGENFFCCKPHVDSSRLSRKKRNVERDDSDSSISPEPEQAAVLPTIVVQDVHHYVPSTEYETDGQSTAPEKNVKANGGEWYNASDTEQTGNDTGRTTDVMVVEEPKSSSDPTADVETESEWEMINRKDRLMKTKVALSDRSGSSPQKSDQGLTGDEAKEDGEQEAKIDTTSKYDITWYKCCPSKEEQFLRSISMTDSGVRLSAMLAVCRICQRDWRLQIFTSYHVQTAMLHNADHHVDATPRWQRNTLEHCTKAILKQLHHFSKIERLPHFFVQGVNLWEDIPVNKLHLAMSALDRLVSSDIALTSLICRAGEFTLPPDIQVYSSLLTSHAATAREGSKADDSVLGSHQITNYFNPPNETNRTLDILTQGLGAKLLESKKPSNELPGVLKSKPGPVAPLRVADAMFVDMASLRESSVTSQSGTEGKFKTQIDFRNSHKFSKLKPIESSRKPKAT